MPDSSSRRFERCKEFPVLCDRRGGHTAGFLVSRLCYRYTRSRMFGVPWPRVPCLRSNNRGDLIQGRRVSAFKGIVFTQACRDTGRIHWVEHCSACYGVNAPPKMEKISLDPIWRHTPVGIRCEQDSVGANKRCRTLHCQSPSGACTCVSKWELVLDHLDRNGRRTRHFSHEGRSPVCRVVDHQHDRVCVSCLLPRQSHDTRFDPLGLVLHRHRHNNSRQTHILQVDCTGILIW